MLTPCCRYSLVSRNSLFNSFGSSSERRFLPGELIAVENDYLHVHPLRQQRQLGRTDDKPLFQRE
jgi:hypothetical protein